MKIIGHTRSAAIVSSLCQLTELFCSTQRDQIISRVKSDRCLGSVLAFQNKSLVAFQPIRYNSKKTLVAFQPIRNNETRDIRTRVPLIFFFFSRTFWRAYLLEFVGGGESKSTSNTHKWATKLEVLFETFYHETHSFTTVANFWHRYLTVLLLYLGKRRSALEILNFFLCLPSSDFRQEILHLIVAWKAAEHQTFVESNWFSEDKMIFMKVRRFSKRKTLHKGWNPSADVNSQCLY